MGLNSATPRAFFSNLPLGKWTEIWKNIQKTTGLNYITKSQPAPRFYKDKSCCPGKTAHSPGLGAWSLCTGHAHSPWPASGCPCCSAALVPRHLASPSVNHKGQTLPGHPAEWFFLDLIHYTDWPNVTGSLAKIPGRVSHKERRERRMRMESRGLEAFGGASRQRNVGDGKQRTAATAVIPQVRSVCWILG